MNPVDNGCQETNIYSKKEETHTQKVWGKIIYSKKKPPDPEAERLLDRAAHQYSHSSIIRWMVVAGTLWTVRPAATSAGG